MYIGDGINDILCLQESTLGVSINSTSELNRLASDIILLQPDLTNILIFIKILKTGNLFIKICIMWAFIYNIAMIPFASGIFYNYFIEIPPYAASVAMSGSSLIVVFTA